MTFTKEQVRAFIRRSVEIARGDDLERAVVAFRGLPESAMQREFGFSGKTCAQILDEYRNHVELWRAAMKMLEDLWF